MAIKRSLTVAASVAIALTAYATLHAAFGVDNLTDQKVSVCLVEGDQDSIKWTWRDCDRHSRVGFDAGAFYQNQIYWVVVVAPNGVSAPGVNITGGFLRYWHRTADLPPGNKKIKVGELCVRKMVNGDWSDFIKIAGTHTTQYNAIMMLCRPGKGTVTDNNLKYDGRYVLSYGKVAQNDADYNWIDDLLGSKTFPLIQDKEHAQTKGLKAPEAGLQFDLDKLQVIKPPAPKRMCFVLPLIGGF